VLHNKITINRYWGKVKQESLAAGIPDSLQHVEKYARIAGNLKSELREFEMCTLVLMVDRKFDEKSW
jgi:hypothetical protein